MKLPSRIIVFIIVPALLLSSVRAALPNTKKPKAAIVSRHSATTANELGRIRGGAAGSEGPIPFLTKDGMTKFGAVYFGVQGVPRAADPATYWKHYGIEIPRGSLTEFCAAWNGVAALGIAIMSYLAMFSSASLSAAQMIAYAALPCVFFTFQKCYKDEFKRFGFWEGSGTLVTTTTLGPVCMLLAEKGDPDIVGALLYGPSLVVGSLSYLFPETSVKLCGLNGFSSGKK